MSYNEVKERSAKVLAELAQLRRELRLAIESDKAVPVRQREDVQ